MSTPAKILLVDDHPIVRAGCREFLEHGLAAKVIEAGSGEEGWRAFVEHNPDLVILDLTMPGAGGLEVLQKLRAHDPRARVLIFSMHANPIFAKRAVQAGAKGYVVKSSPPEELLKAVQEVLRGGNYLSHEIAQEMALINLGTGPNPLDELSARELEILRLVGAGRSLAEIAAILCIGYKTAANCITQLKNKVRARHTSDLVRIAIQHGLIDNPR